VLLARLKRSLPSWQVLEEGLASTSENCTAIELVGIFMAKFVCSGLIRRSCGTGKLKLKLSHRDNFVEVTTSPFDLLSKQLFASSHRKYDTFPLKETVKGVNTIIIRVLVF
jgi:hypothetical protein